MGKRSSGIEAAGIFFDHFGLSPGKPGLDELLRVVNEFSGIPWENLTKFLAKTRGAPPDELPRSPGTVMRGYVEAGTGGTCFSLTETLRCILSFQGYRCRPVMADMSHGRDIHCALLVEFQDGETFLADPGYLVPRPVGLSREKTVSLALGDQVMLWKPDGKGGYDLYTTSGDGVETWRYRLKTAPVSRKEFMEHWTRSFDAPGMNSLHANLRNGDARFSAHNMNLRMVDNSGKRNEKMGKDYPGLMESRFGISGKVAGAAEEAWRRSCRNR